MKIGITTASPESISTHVTTAARLASLPLYGPHAFVAPVPNARSTFALDVAPEQARGHRAMSSDVAGASLWWRRVATVAGLIMLVDLVGRVLGSCGGAR